MADEDRELTPEEEAAEQERVERLHQRADILMLDPRRFAYSFAVAEEDIQFLYHTLVELQERVVVLEKRPYLKEVK